MDLRTTASSHNAAPSGVSFLPSAAAQADTTISIPTQQSPIDSNNVQINSNNATNSSSDLLATTNLSLPAGCLEDAYMLWLGKLF
jgi:D-arabinose 5-phosphate isomerase GutQ